MLKPRSSRLLEISSAGVSDGSWRIAALIGFSEFGGEGKIEFIFLQVALYC
jgi:hypothetical protein